MTTGTFTREAKAEAVRDGAPPVDLIDGDELARLMVLHGVGVRTRVHHEVKRIDEDYFEQEAL